MKEIISFQTYLVLASCFTEITNMGYSLTGARHLRPLAWAMFASQQYYLVGDKVVRKETFNIVYSLSAKQNFAFSQKRWAAIGIDW